MTTCPSVDTRLVGRNLESYPCERQAGHEGYCVDAEGGTWTRLGELLRQRNEGPQIRKRRR